MNKLSLCYPNPKKLTKSKIYKILFNTIKIILFIVFIGLIYWQVKSRSGEYNLIDAFNESFSWQQIPYLLIAIVMLPVNILLETTKWKTFINQFQEKFSFQDALKSMLCGSFFGFISPNRVGEFLGRLKRIEPENRSRSLTAGYWGGLAQFIVTFSFGIYMGGRTIMNHMDIEWSLDRYTLPIAFVIILITSLVYFNLKHVLVLVSKFPLLRKITKKYPLEYDVSKRKLLIILFITLSRYLVYVFQYIFILYFFGVDLPFEVLFSSVSTMLVIHTLVPSVPFIDLGVKGTTLSIILSGLSNNELGIFLSVLTIWIINIILPAIAGYYFFIASKKDKEQKNLNF